MCYPVRKIRQSSTQNCVREQHKCGTGMHMYIYDYTNQFLLLKCNENEKSKSFQNKKYLEVIFCSEHHGFSTLPCARSANPDIAVE